MARAQVSFEFMTIIVVVVLITVVFGIIAADRISELRNEKQTLQLEDLANKVKNEIDIAHAMQTGFERNFDLPYYIGNENYTIDIEKDLVVITIKDRSFAAAIQPINGTFVQGPNLIKKIPSGVVLNG